MRRFYHCLGLSRNFSPRKLYRHVVVVVRSPIILSLSCVRALHARLHTDDTLATMCARHQPNEGRKVHSYCINSSLSFLSRAHLNQQKAPTPDAGWCPLSWALNAFLPLLPPPFDRHSTTKLNPPLASPKKPSSCFRATLEPAQSRREWCTPPTVRNVSPSSPMAD